MERKNENLQTLDERYKNLIVLGEKSNKIPSVFLVRDREKGTIAVKKYVDSRVLPVYVAADRLKSRHLAKLYAYGSEGERGIIIEEYISGMTLENYMRVSGKIGEQEACHITCELLDILSKIHREGIVHRDITPANILISGDGVLKLIDFGIARQNKENKKKDTTIMGTVGYAAPEQFGFQQTDARTDIYAVGILFNQMLTGKMPDDVIYQKKPYFGIIRKCIEMDARARYQSADEMKAVLEKQIQKHSLKEEKTEGKVSLAWLPGFRSASVKKNVAAAFLYVLFILVSVSAVSECAATWQTGVLEMTAVALYIWAAGLLAGNIGNWDQRIWPICRLPRAARIAIRAALWLLIFYLGVSLENHVKFDMLGLPKP